MDKVGIFENFAADFEATLADDDWSRLEKYLAENATYVNVGSPDPKCEGRESIIDFLRADVSKTDRRFDTRTLVALSPPKVEGNRLSRQWRVTYTLAGVPNLVLEGEARYLFEGEFIKEIEQELTPSSIQHFEEWMHNHGERLHKQ